MQKASTKFATTCRGLVLAGSLCLAIPGQAHDQGKASFYHDMFHGRTTACGQTFDQDRMTAAHKELPCGTRVKVTRRDTGQSVVVTVNDRGPFVRGRIIDLSKAAARKLR
ncbi:MAG: septal ring lytic transglycosylase RlpA family protein, partial [Candidatus Competibacterales bacterium]|nr:septal ring lytic transglycosylase RlpA family protein [Candidatus Competibacterales bacterium]